MKNIKMTTKDNILTIEVDLSKNYGLSVSGKSEIIASTEGNQAIPESDAKIGVNIYKPIKKR